MKFIHVCIPIVESVCLCIVSSVCVSIECRGDGSGVQECNESFNFGMGDSKWKEYVWFEMISELIELSDKRIVCVCDSCRPALSIVSMFRL